MEIEYGDSVKFGVEWCNKYGSKNLLNKTIMMTPQYFEEDNGLYSYESECPGIWDEKSQEADSIYHLFGNHFEWFSDCQLIKGTQADKDYCQQLINNRNDEISKGYEEMAKGMLESE